MHLKSLKLINRIPPRTVFFSMAIQITLPGKSPQVVELQSAPAIRADNLQIKIYEITVIDRIALGVADSMRIMTGRARRPRILDMFFMLRKTLVTQYTLPAVAFIAQGVG
jgi:hypothetical protein